MAERLNGSDKNATIMWCVGGSVFALSRNDSFFSRESSIDFNFVSLFAKHFDAFSEDNLTAERGKSLWAIEK